MRDLQALYCELRNERWTVVDTGFWFLLGLVTGALGAWSLW